jgi:putative oxygen-independent coproporphyrinogen III oxidase
LTVSAETLPAGAAVAARPRGHGSRHLYVHLPFCAHRCGYCDFVTVVGRPEQHGDYADALLWELGLRSGELATELETVYLGGGTPTLTETHALERLLQALPPALEVTVEANPETITPHLTEMLIRAGVTRVSLGAQSFATDLLEVLERRATPDVVRRAVHHLRDASFDNVSLDLVYGIPGQSAAALEHDLAEAVALDPEHLSCYELEAKPGTRFTHRWGSELERQAEAMEGYLELVVETLTAAGYRWYETANFCRHGTAAEGRDLRAAHNLGYWRGRDYVGVGIGAVSTVGGVRRRNGASLGGYLDALAAGGDVPHELEAVDAETARAERVMLGLRLDEPLHLGEPGAVGGVIDAAELSRLESRGLVDVERAGDGEPTTIRLTRRGRFLGGGVTARLLA